jgi:hypothetical protein
MSAVDGLFTVNDVVIAALRKSGIIGLGQVPAGDDILDAQNDLSDMLAQWNSKTWLIWEKIDMGTPATGQATPYTIGPGGNINVTVRPDRIEAAYLRILSGGIMPVDQPLRLIPSGESYSDIALKKLVAFTKGWYYQPATPLGNLYFYPWPQGSGLYEMHVIFKDAFPLTLPLNM